MTSDFPVVIDACVLVQAAVRDTLLRLSERRLFLCKWTDEIIEEMVRTLQNKLSRTPEQTDYLVSELRTHFADAWVEPGYRELISVMPNHPKDRHVVAAAVKAGCEVIITYNVKDFPVNSLRLLDIRPMTPDEYLLGLYFLNPETVIHVLHEQGAALHKTKSLAEVLMSLESCRCVQFAALIRERFSL
jgi:predicted nucleic acid-binding protein